MYQVRDKAWGKLFAKVEKAPLPNPWILGSSPRMTTGDAGFFPFTFAQGQNDYITFTHSASLRAGTSPLPSRERKLVLDSPLSLEWENGLLRASSRNDVGYVPRVEIASTA